ncbi:MAG TPA: hypothetical protein VGG01_19780 [Xanthobacteraceae bacterium]
MSRGEIKILSVMTAISVAILIVAGRFTPQDLPDTPGYLHVVGYPALLSEPRTPLYGWVVAALALGGSSHLAVPAFQIATYVAAVWFLVAQSRRFGLSATASLSVGAALLIANAFVVDANWVHPELLSIACGLVAVGATVELAHPQAHRFAWWLVCASAGVAYVLRPSFLLLVVALPTLYAVLRAIRGDPLRLARAAAILAVSIAPFIGIASLRAATVGDFNIVSFGGFAMSGLATLIVSDDTVARVPADIRPFAAHVLAARRDGEASGRMIGIPRNASDERSFYSAALGYFDVLARTHDDGIYQVITPTRQANESWVDFNRRLTRFDVAVLRASPGRYAAWIVGAATRVAGRSLVTNLPVALAIIAIVLLWPWRLFVRGEVGVAPRAPLDIPVMAMLAVIWFIGAGVLTMMMSAPSIRYIETSDILVAPLFVYWAVLLASPAKKAAIAKK